MAGKVMAGTPKAILGALNASTHLKNGIDGAGKAMAEGAKAKGAAMSDFGSQVRGSDAGRAVESLARNSLDKSLRSAGADGVDTDIGPKKTPTAPWE
jgi:hypothetical protein